MSSATSPAGAATVWQLTLPARTPYDRELLVQTIRHTVTRWGTARVAIGRCRLLFVGCPAIDGERCPLCGRCPGLMHCRVAGRDTCVGCALETAAPEPCTNATIGVDADPPPTQRKPQQPRRRNAPADRKASSAN